MCMKVKSSFEHSGFYWRKAGVLKISTRGVSGTRNTRVLSSWLNGLLGVSGTICGRTTWYSVPVLLNLERFLNGVSGYIDEVTVSVLPGHFSFSSNCLLCPDNGF